MQPKSIFLEHGALSLAQVKKTFEAKAELCIDTGSEVYPEKTAATVQMGKVKERGNQKSAPGLGGGVSAWAMGAVSAPGLWGRCQSLN